MRKIVFLVVVGLGISMIAYKNTIKNIFVTSPTPYHQQRTKYFEKLSLEFYGVDELNYVKNENCFEQVFKTREVKVYEVKC